MSVWTWIVLPLSLAGAIYAVLAVGYLLAQGRPGMALAFVGYVLANVGLVWDALSFRP